jgi:hypothetical protein
LTCCLSFASYFIDIVNVFEEALGGIWLVAWEEPKVFHRHNAVLLPYTIYVYDISMHDGSGMPPTAVTGYVWKGELGNCPFRLFCPSSSAT